MNKKILSRFLLGSALAVSLGVIAVSCEIKEKDKTSTPTLPDKKPKITTTIDDLNSEANKVTIDYPNKNTILASEVVKESFNFLGYDSEKFKILLIDVKGTDQNGSAVVKFKVTDINNENKQSSEKEITISDFKKVPLTIEQLKTIAKDIKLDYEGKANIFPWDSQPGRISVTNTSTTTSISDLKVTGINPNNLNAVATFILSDKYNPEVKINNSFEISGFKTLSNDHSNLTKTLFSDEKGFIILDKDPSIMFSLYKELAKPDAELTLSFDSSQILIPKNGKVVNILDPETYIDVGSLTSAYKELHKKLLSEATGVVSYNLTILGYNVYSIVSEFFTLSKDEAIKQFESQKSKLGLAEYWLGRYVNFIKDFDKNIEKLIKRDNYSVVYNPKTGLFSMQSGEAEIDLNKPDTFIDFIGFHKNVTDQINNKIKEVLKENVINESIVDLFIGDKNFNSVYLFQKKGNELVTGLKVKQIPSKSPEANPNN